METSRERMMSAREYDDLELRIDRDASVGGSDVTLGSSAAMSAGA